MTSPKLFVVSAPSGGGKTTIVRAIMEKHPEIEFSVSATTREKRLTEIDGKDYFFLSKEKFEGLSAQALAEHEIIYGNYYGTLRSEVDRVLNVNGTMLFDVDVKGGLSIQRCYPQHSILIFIRPPSLQILEERLRNRKTESEETFRRRMDRVAIEMELGTQFHYTVINDRLDAAIEEVNTIINQYLS